MAHRTADIRNIALVGHAAAGKTLLAEALLAEANFRCAPGDITRPERHTLLFNPEVESGSMIIQDGVILTAHCGPATAMNTGFIISTDMGKTWAQYDLKEFGKRSPTRFHEKNGEGWFRVDLRSGWIQRAEVVFIKPT